MKEAIIITIGKSKKRFENIKLGKGLYLFDLQSKKSWNRFSDDFRKKYSYNVSIIILPDELDEISDIGKMDLIDVYFETVSLYLFINSQVAINPRHFYEGCFDEKNELIIKKGCKESKYLIGDVFLFGDFDPIGYQEVFNEEDFILMKNDVKNFLQYEILVKAQLRHHEAPPLYQSINLFVSAYGNNGWEETKFILTLSSMEALFVKADHELSFRLAHNIAFFMFPKFEQYNERIELMKQIKKLYSIRSKEVHGLPNKKIHTIDSYEEAQDLLCAIYKKIVSEYKISDIFLNNNLHSDFLSCLEAGYLNINL